MMTINEGARGILEVNNGRIIHRNFRGEGSKFNREGDRNFSLVIEDISVAEELIKDGWNVKIKPPKEEGDEPYAFLPIKVKFNGRGPKVYLKTGDNQSRLDEDTVSLIDDIDIVKVDLDIRPYDWEVNGKTGRTAYLQGMKVEQEVDRFM